MYKKVLIFIGCIIVIKFVFNKIINNNIHNNRIYHDRIRYIQENNIPLSGIMIHKRQPAFDFLGLLNKFLPYHRVLEIPLPNGTKRFVGLAPYCKNNKDTCLKTQYLLQTGPIYQNLNLSYKKSFPIEAWVEYNNRFGKYPTILDPSIVNRLTLTREELEKENIFTNSWRGLDFLTFTKYENKTPTIFSCRSAIMSVIERAELIEKKEYSFDQLLYNNVNPYPTTFLEFILYKINNI